ncbi:MAG TPA: NIPSNAP family containing protein [Prolixibacteraceae bacterium]|nr:NIPSNAP family containing protein [Prolixibacteraceae bacterium]
MERRNFLKATAAVAAVTATGSALNAKNAPAPGDEFYEFRIYQLTHGGNGKSTLKSYFTEALMPLFKKYDVRLGAFEELDKEEPAKIYTLFAYPSAQVYYEMQQYLVTDTDYLAAAKSYFGLPAAKPVYERYETFLMDAFDGIPNLKLPEKNRGLFELRTYESYNEDAARRKVAMFNDEELPLFEQVGLHPVFFGKILAGKYMPALMYMLWFKDMDECVANWKKFVDSPEWKAMSGKAIYAETVSKVRKKFLTPTDYSQI